MKISRQQIREIILYEISQRIGLGGVNSDGPRYNRFKNKYISGHGSGGYSGDSDSGFSDEELELNEIRRLIRRFA